MEPSGAVYVESSAQDSASGLGSRMSKGLAGKRPGARRGDVRGLCDAFVTLQVIPRASVGAIHMGEWSRQVFDKKTTGGRAAVAAAAGLSGKSGLRRDVVTSL